MAAETAAPGKVLRVRTLGDPLTLDWNRAYTPVEATLVRNVMEGLVAIGPRMKVVPALAEKWKTSKDGRTYVFTLRKDVKWSDGAKLTAQQFVDSWKRLLEPSFKGNYAYLLFDIDNAQAFHEGSLRDFSKVGVRAIDERTLEVRLRAPIAYWIWIPTFWATFPIRADLIAKDGSRWDKPGSLVTLGPFTYASYEPHRNVTLKRNPGYYGKRGNIETIVAALVEEESTAIRLYDDNQLDFITRLAVEAKRLRGRPDFVQWQEARIVHLDFNPAHPAASSQALRKAIAMSIDKAKLSSLLEGSHSPASSFVPPGIMGFDGKAGLPFDPIKAKVELEASGYFAKHAGQSLDLVVSNYNDEVLTAGFIRDELKRHLGLEVRIQTYEPKQFYSPLVTFGGFAMILNRWTADFPDPDNFFSIFLSKAGNNRVSWKNSTYDQNVIAARTITDSKKREKLYFEIQRQLIHDEVIAVPLFYGRNCALIRYGVTGFEPTPTNSYLFKDFSIGLKK